MYQTIFTDIDFVLHDYSLTFLKAIKKIYKDKNLEVKDIDDKIKSVLNKGSLEVETPLQLYSEELGLSTQQVEEAVKIGGAFTEHYHTPFSSNLIYAYINLYLNHGVQIIAITARGDRDSAKKLIENIFPGFMNVPVVCCETSHKYLLTENSKKSIYIEDHPKAVELSSFNEDLKIIVPKWPWNRDVVKKNNIYHVEHNQVSFVLNSLIQMKKEVTF